MGMLVNAITPAAPRTAILERMKPAQIGCTLCKTPIGRFFEAQQIAAMAVWPASEDCPVCTGAVFNVAGGRAY